MSRPLPKFDLNQPVKLDKKLYDGKEQPIVVGYEWADDNRRTRVKSDTYLSWIRFESGLEWFPVAEEELIAWGN